MYLPSLSLYARLDRPPFGAAARCRFRASAARAPARLGDASAMASAMRIAYAAQLRHERATHCALRATMATATATATAMRLHSAARIWRSTG